jgi:MFS family permease
MFAKHWKSLVSIRCSIDSASLRLHSGGHILGPLKSQLHQQLGTSHTEFGLLLSTYSLNSTWTPFVGGLLASRLGTTSMSILTTGVILVGEHTLFSMNTVLD